MPTSIRKQLIGLFFVLGASLLVSIAVQIWTAGQDYRMVRFLQNSNEARQDLMRLSVALTDERTNLYLSRAGIDATITQESTDRFLESSRSKIDATRNDPVAPVLRSLESELTEIRSDVTATPSEVFDRMSVIGTKVVGIRHDLLARENDAASGVVDEVLLRRYNALILEELGKQAAYVPIIWQDRLQTPDVMQKLERSRGATEMLVGFLLDQAGSQNSELRDQIKDAAIKYRSAVSVDVFAPIAAADPVSRSSAESMGVVAAEWRERHEAAEQAAVTLQFHLFDISSASLDRLERKAIRNASIYLFILVVGVVAVAVGARIVVVSVMGRLELMKHQMLSLASGDLDVSVPTDPTLDEIGQMNDALRVLKANSIRRSRLQVERLALHERLKVTYRQMREDLQAAAVVQSALLPKSREDNGVRFGGKLQQSHYIGGDTYDVLRTSSGRTRFFQIDVAGHGAAAALISVASHNLLSQTMLENADDCDFAAMAARVNAAWSPTMPYFTMVLGEVDIANGTGRLVQAGHPSPILIAPDGAIRILGDGGLPIGIIANAEYHEITFPFTPGSRLLVYSDGLTEAENAQGEAFGDDRLLDLIERHSVAAKNDLLVTLTSSLQRWRGSNTFEDDVTILVLEAIGENGYH